MRMHKVSDAQAGLKCSSGSLCAIFICQPLVYKSFPSSIHCSRFTIFNLILLHVFYLPLFLRYWIQLFAANVVPEEIQFHTRAALIVRYTLRSKNDICLQKFGTKRHLTKTSEDHLCKHEWSEFDRVAQLALVKFHSWKTLKAKNYLQLKVQADNISVDWWQTGHRLPLQECLYHCYHHGSILLD